MIYLLQELQLVHHILLSPYELVRFGSDTVGPGWADNDVDLACRVLAVKVKRVIFYW